MASPPDIREGEQGRIETAREMRTGKKKRKKTSTHSRGLSGSCQEPACYSNITKIAAKKKKV